MHRLELVRRVRLHRLEGLHVGAGLDLVGAMGAERSDALGRRLEVELQPEDATLGEERLLRTDVALVKMDRAWG